MIVNECKMNCQENDESFRRRNSGVVINFDGHIESLSEMLLKNNLLNNKEAVTYNEFIDYFYELVEEDDFIQNIQRYQDVLQIAVKRGIFDPVNYKKLVNKKVYKLLNNEYIVYNLSQSKFEKLCANNMHIALRSEYCIDRMDDEFLVYLCFKYNNKYPHINTEIKYAYDTYDEIVADVNDPDSPAYDFHLSIIANCLHFNNNYGGVYSNIFKDKISLSEYNPNVTLNKKEFDKFLELSALHVKFVDSITDTFARELLNRIKKLPDGFYIKNFKEFGYLRFRVEAIGLLKNFSLDE